MDDVKITQVTDPRVVALLKGTAEGRIDIPEASFLRALQTRLLYEADTLCLVAAFRTVIKNEKSIPQVCGYAVAYTQPETPYAFLYYVWTDKDWFGPAHVRKVLQYICSWAKLRGYEELRTERKDTSDVLISRYGFKEVSRIYALDLGDPDGLTKLYTTNLDSDQKSENDRGSTSGDPEPRSGDGGSGVQGSEDSGPDPRAVQFEAESGGSDQSGSEPERGGSPESYSKWQ